MANSELWEKCSTSRPVLYLQSKLVEKKTLNLLIKKNFKSQIFFKMISQQRIESLPKDLDVSLRLGSECPSLIHFYGALFYEVVSKLISFINHLTFLTNAIQIQQNHYWLLTELMSASLDTFQLKASQLRLHLPEVFYAKVSLAVLEALSYMRQHKLMHRDIKPDNILLNSDGEIKLCDFGLSGFTENSVCKSFVGCHLYMPVDIIY